MIDMVGMVIIGVVVWVGSCGRFGRCGKFDDSRCDSCGVGGL